MDIMSAAPGGRGKDMLHSPLAVSVSEARRHLGGVSVATIYRLLDRGELDRRKIGGRAVIMMESIKALLERGTHHG